ncbi:type VI secretion system protein TssA [Herbaspirillum sp. SJZ107]|uniref:type VI secretion system protein TssA n=1 Tax=Herbaspirillum sp. SJZ107 TaxID=2572881 RepID=UPI001150C2C8|nr:type VI secretion system protein TssA [Herbaspirillum sp. SJZ107]TQK10952.1 type VI secretion system protein ImpA [Herbaspirillum sp. SJZ107]
MLDIDKLLAPVSEQQPCGEDLAFSSEIDAIVRARQADDPSIEQGAWVTDLKEADWKFVARQCAQLIEKRSKDLQLAVWLAEAGVKTGGVRGLAGSLELIAALCERHWDGMYPLPDEDGFERRIGNLAWVAARIAPWLRAVPLTEGNPPGGSAYALSDFDVARAHGGEELAKLEAARQRGARSFYRNLLRDCGQCKAAIDRLEQSVDARLGADGPSFSAAKSGLESVLMFVKPLAGEEPAETAALPDAAPATPAAPGQGGSDAPSARANGPLQNRVQALAQLRAVAEFFRRTEPHSPVAYLAEKAAHWGEQPLHVWLRAVVKDDASFAHIEELLGVETKS